MVVLLVVVVVVAGVASVVRTRRHTLVPKRGFGVGADLAGLAETPTVRIRSLARTSPTEVRVVFVGEGGPEDEREVRLALSDEDYGLELLEEWQQAGSRLAVVVPPESRILRLRSVTTLQHLTLRRAD